jgi:hypothetical protein
MSLFSPTPIPPEDSWDTLREWRMQTFVARYKIGLAVALRIISLVVLLAGAALLFLEPSKRTVFLIVTIWCIGVPLAALGYVRKMDRMAARVPITPATKNPTTTVDITSRDVLRER